MSQPPDDRANRQGSNTGEAPDLAAEEITLNAGTPEHVAEIALKGERLKTVLGLILGFFVIVLGAALAVLGYKGTVDFGLEVGGIKAHVVTGSLGIGLAVIGAVVIWWTRYKVTINGQGATQAGKTSGGTG